MLLPANCEFTPENSKSILGEAPALLEARKRTEPGARRLDCSSANQLASNDFWSLCCFGHKGDDVSLELFNASHVFPSTDWAVHLVANSSTIQLAWAESFHLQLSTHHLLLSFFPCHAHFSFFATFCLQ
jgi:hypothetical protein